MGLPALFWFPLLSGTLLPATFLLCYGIARYLGHTAAETWPYISDTATIPPESCIFSQLVNIGTFFVAITIYIRYKQVGEYCSSYQLPSRLAILNTLTLGVGWGGTLGLSLLANFQETEVKVIHLTGLYLCFGLGLLWMWGQVHSTVSLYPLCSSLLLVTSRLLLALTFTLTFITMLVAGQIASHYHHDGQDPSKWTPGDSGWRWHVLSTGSEWVMALSLDLTILSLVPEFTRISLQSPRICLRIDPSASLVDIRDSIDNYSQSSLLA